MDILASDLGLTINEIIITGNWEKKKYLLAFEQLTLFELHPTLQQSVPVQSQNVGFCALDWAILKGLSNKLGFTNKL